MKQFRCFKEQWNKLDASKYVNFAPTIEFIQWNYLDASKYINFALAIEVFQCKYFL